MNVVFLHGFGETAIIWEDFIKLLSPDHKYFTPDYSEKKEFFSIPDYADWLKKQLSKNEIEDFVIIGHSMGGYISLEFCAQYPNRIKGLGLFHSSAAEDSDEKKEARDKTVKFLIKHDSEMFIKHFYPDMFTEEFKKHNEDFLEKNIALFSQISNEALMAATLAMKARKDKFEALQSFEFPVFQIIGKNDSFVPCLDALSQTNKIKNPNVLLSTSISHAGMYENPKLCAEFINDFLKSI
jgi:pimeloyl-ACP methyl ester carboxylesterase